MSICSVPGQFDPPMPQTVSCDDGIMRYKHQPDGVVRSAFEGAGLDRADFSPWPKHGPPTPLRSFRSEKLMLTVAVESAGAAWISIEVWCRAWAFKHGIPALTVRASDVSHNWFVADYVQAAEARGPDYVDAALDAADAIAALDVPCIPGSVTMWRAPRRTLIQRTVRLALGGVSLRQFVKARRAADQLTLRCCSHGDFYRRNVLNAGSGQILIVDWEYIGSAPRFTDHLRFWSTLREVEDRQIAWSRIVSGRTEGELRHIRVLATWLVWRLLAENLSAPGYQRDPSDLAHARAMVEEIKGLLRD